MLHDELENLTAVGLGHSDLELSLLISLEQSVESDGLYEISSGNESVVGFGCKGQGKDSLLLEVGLVDTSKGSSENESTSCNETLVDA